MAAPFTIGIEEEFQLVDRQTGQLSPGIQSILERGHAIFGEQIKAEMLQPTVELISDILPDIVTARKEMQVLRGRLARLAQEEGLALVSAGTHPTALWQDQLRSPHERYAQLEDELQDVARSILIFGQHIHIGVENQEAAVILMNPVANVASTFAGPFLQLTFLGRASDRPQILSFRCVEALPAQRGTGSFPLLERF